MSLKILFITTSFGNYSDSQTIRYFQYLTGINDDEISVDFIVPNCENVNLDLFKKFNFYYRIFKTDKIISQKIEKFCSRSVFLLRFLKI